jgi:glycosyltransferase involved in cell wall biosynthesis
MVTPFPEEPDRIVGGVAGVARYLVPALVATGRCEIQVVAPGSNAERVSEFRGAAVHYLRRIRGPGLALYWTRERARIAASLAEIAPDIVHFQGVAGWSFGCPFPRVLTLHGVNERDVLYSRGPCRRLRSRLVGSIERRARRSFEHVISISPYLESVIGDHLRGRVWPIENPVDDLYFDVERSPDARSVLFAGRITERKNLLGAIEALGRMRGRPDVGLRIAGDSLDTAYRGRCVALAERLGLAARITWLGSLTAHEVRRELASAACLLLPSFQETAPLAIEEAMAAGVPVVASDVCGIPHLVRDGVTGVLVRPHDPDHIAAGLERVLSSDATRSGFGAAGRAAAELRFRASRVAEQTVRAYEAACSDSKDSP